MIWVRKDLFEQVISYRFGGIFVLILTFLYVHVVRLMARLSKSVKVKNAVSATYLLLFYNTKNRLHFSSQYIEFNAECDDSVSEIFVYTGIP